MIAQKTFMSVFVVKLMSAFVANFISVFITILQVFQVCECFAKCEMVVADCMSITSEELYHGLYVCHKI